MDKACRENELLIKEALRIQLAPKDTIMNKDEGIELLGCLIKAVCGIIVPVREVGGTDVPAGAVDGTGSSTV